jgi:ribosomal protein S3AE
VETLETAILAGRTKRTVLKTGAAFAQTTHLQLVREKVRRLIARRKPTIDEISRIIVTRDPQVFPQGRQSA